ncbi:hypothetical protein MHYP_G00089160 [Metynnis hypsauchen]
MLRQNGAAAPLKVDRENSNEESRQAKPGSTGLRPPCSPKRSRRTFRKPRFCPLLRPQAWKVEKREILRRAEELMEYTSRNRTSVKVRDPMMNHLDLERENLQLEDRMFRLEMEMQEEREAWKVEKRDILRRGEELMEDTSRNRASMEEAASASLWGKGKLLSEDQEHAFADVVIADDVETIA